MNAVGLGQLEVMQASSREASGLVASCETPSIEKVLNKIQTAPERLPI